MKNFIQKIKDSVYAISNSYQMFSEEKEPSIRDEAVLSLARIVSDYSNWYDQRGLYLPPDYAKDPSAWSEALHKMKRAFSLLRDDMYGKGELWEARNKWKTFGEEDLEKIKELESEIKEGLELFGSQLFYLTDNWEGVESGH